MKPPRQVELVSEVGWARAFAADLLGSDHFIDRGDFGGGSAIVAFTFGNRITSRSEIVPGPVNRAIAVTALSLSLQRPGAEMPILAQHEVAMALDGHCRPINRDNDFYMTTRDVAEVASEELSSMGFSDADKHVTAVGHNRHIGRIIYELKRAEIIPVAVVPVKPTPYEFDMGSNEIWTTGRVRWALHETGVFAGLKVERHFPSLAEKIQARAISAKHESTKTSAY
jgi:hypothetical protein